MSLSSRRAWIEITLVRHKTLSFMKSLSSRRAWIEINKQKIPLHWPEGVALLAEGVD